MTPADVNQGLGVTVKAGYQCYWHLRRLAAAEATAAKAVEHKVGLTDFGSRALLPRGWTGSQQEEKGHKEPLSCSALVHLSVFVFWEACQLLQG